MSSRREKDILLYTDSRLMGGYYYPVDAYVWEIGQYINNDRFFTGILV